MALGIDSPSDREARICARTFWSSKQTLMSACGAERLFDRITQVFVKDCGAGAGCVRLDSTHAFSNMNDMRRAEIFRCGLKNFLTAMEREQGGNFAKTDRALVEWTFFRPKTGILLNTASQPFAETVRGPSSNLL